ncbi:class I SAM-dependent methyltransferase [Sphingomonas sp. URHD0057]|uniref:class I SAM-dependent methyltransferase n=1 Tax=Sphingomonas sp. URHD0057 TaxID=1380389 RepID=UPI000687107F|nr:methyltransferase domain-containing protein [Sphingomonas sp. URHD0057]
MTTGAPVATKYTFDFVRRSLPEQARSVLEIGCGAGELAARLAGAGLQVLALDSDSACVAEAKARGVDAVALDWPSAIEQRFDAVLFTRSLHHIHDLDGAIAEAVAVLRPGERVIVEDFRSEGGGPCGRAWFSGLVRLLHSAGAFRPDFDLEHTLGKIETVDHEHPLHSSGAIADALARAGPVEADDSAYYFRYLEADLRSPDAVCRLLEYELEMISADAIEALGKRFVLST